MTTPTEPNLDSATRVRMRGGRNVHAMTRVAGTTREPRYRTECWSHYVYLGDHLLPADTEITCRKCARIVLAARVARVGPTRAPRGTGDAHTPEHGHGEGSDDSEASQRRSEAQEGSSLDWHYGPTATDPDPGKMWHQDCGQEVMHLEGGHICGCGAQDNDQPEETK